MSVPALSSGKLPMGRWSATVDEIEAAYVTGQGERREQIWQDWLRLTEALRYSLTDVPAAWLSGSFLTDKPEPRDIDCVYIVESHVLLGARIDAERAQFLQVVATSGVKDAFGLSVDSFIMEWVPRPGTLRADWARQYREDRGYWDDLWSRERSTDAREDSVPRRGYLEVILDGYN